MEDVGRTAILLIKQAWNAAIPLLDLSSRARDRALGREIVAVMTQREFICAMADAARGLVAVSQLLHSKATVQQPVCSAAAHNMLMGTTAATMCMYVQGIAWVLFEHLKDSPEEPRVPPGVTKILDALVQSQLLGAAAATLVDTPNTFTASDLSPDRRQQTTLWDLRYAVCSMALTVHRFSKLRCDLATFCGPEGRRMAGGLSRAMGHVAIQRLQV